MDRLLKAFLQRSNLSFKFVSELVGNWQTSASDLIHAVPAHIAEQISNLRPRSQNASLPPSRVT